MTELKLRNVELPRFDSYERTTSFRDGKERVLEESGSPVSLCSVADARDGVYVVDLSGGFEGPYSAQVFTNYDGNSVPITGKVPIEDFSNVPKQGGRVWGRSQPEVNCLVDKRYVYFTSWQRKHSEIIASVRTLDEEDEEPAKRRESEHFLVSYDRTNGNVSMSDLDAFFNSLREGGRITGSGHTFCAPYVKYAGPNRIFLTGQNNVLEVDTSNQQPLKVIAHDNDYTDIKCVDTLGNKLLLLCGGPTMVGEMKFRGSAPILGPGTDGLTMVRPASRIVEYGEKPDESGRFGLRDVGVFTEDFGRFCARPKMDQVWLYHGANRNGDVGVFDLKKGDITSRLNLDEEANKRLGKVRDLSFGNQGEVLYVLHDDPKKGTIVSGFRL